MKTYAKFFSILTLPLLSAGSFAQSASLADGNPQFSQPELDQMLAPIALYPDALLSQVLMASSYPLEIVQAERWSSANPGLRGEDAVQAVENQNWDPSVKSLVAFPQVLQTMDQKVEWTERLGDAFLAQQAQVMDTVQTLREKSQEAGKLTSTSEVNVTQTEDSIEIAPTNPDDEYVPYYDPSTAYGAWAYPQYPPVNWGVWPGYGWNGGLAWGPTIVVGASFFFGTMDWRHDHVYSNDHVHGGGNHLWQHDPGHRHGVPYRNASLNSQLGRTAAAPASRPEFHGYESGVIEHAGEGNRVAAQATQRERNEAPQIQERTDVAQLHERAPLPNVRPGYAQARQQAFENGARVQDPRSYAAHGATNGSTAHKSTGAAPASATTPAPGHDSPSEQHH